MKNKALIFTALLLCGCSDHSENTAAKPTPSDCPETATCAGNIRIYCQDGHKATEMCQGNRICFEGECILGQTCAPGQAPSCSGNTRITCENGEIKQTVCDDVCENGECILKTCTDTFVAYCDDQGNSVDCVNGEISIQNCPNDRVCDAGICVVPPKNCGNGQIDAGEKCDDGQLNGTYGKCRKDCSGIASCGDGRIDAPDEKCDDGDLNGTYGKCRIDCSGSVTCGDGHIDASAEICDDGDLNGTYEKCRQDCQSISKCGDGTVDAPDEICDDGALNGMDGRCALNCKSRTGCGDSIVKTGEECDPPSSDYLVSCAADCTIPKQLFPEYPLPGKVNGDIPETCDQSDLWQKYFIYRKRFIGDAEKHIPGFISWGTNPGESLPASYRDTTTSCSKFNGSTSCEYDSSNLGVYDWGDTSLWLGIMVHWLALEYRVFKMYGLDTAETEQYIALSLKAFDRLDLAAEPFFGMEPELNGFFIRDDIPHDFFMKDGHYRFERQDEWGGYRCAASKNTCSVYSDKDPIAMLNDGSFVSQDQITGIYEGFGMVAKFVDDDAEVDGIKLRQAASSTIHRIVMYLRSNQWMLGIQTPHGWEQIPEGWGGYTQMLSSFFAEGANSICGREFGIENYNDEATEYAKQLVPSILTVLWPMWESQNNYNRNLIFRVLNYTKLWDNETFYKTSLESGRENWAHSHAIYWDEPLPDDFPIWRMHTLLESAPCEGPCFGDMCKKQVPGWMGEHYFVSPNYRIGSFFMSGEFNGLDYLISHNEYLLAYAQKTGRPYSQVIPKKLESGHQLKDYIAGKSLPAEYIVSENIGDMDLKFCGRTFADWIRDNALGMIDIYTGKTRWQCTMDGKCILSNDSAAYTHTNAVIIGTDGSDAISVPKGYHHCIASLGGDDNITAAVGAHYIEAGDGDDTIHTYGPQVTVLGGPGNDKIYIPTGGHLVDAGPGDDLIEAGSCTGTNLLFAGDGNDVIHAGKGANWINGGDGNDIIETTSDSLRNIIWHGVGNAKIHIGDGNAIIRFGTGNVFIKAGNGYNEIAAQAAVHGNNIRICIGNGQSVIYSGWISTAHCSAGTNSITYDSCVPDLTEADCTEEAYNNWDL